MPHIKWSQAQKIYVGLAHARKTAEVTVEADTCQITVEPGITITALAPPAVTSGGTMPRTTTMTDSPPVSWHLP